MLRLGEFTALIAVGLLLLVLILLARLTELPVVVVLIVAFLVLLVEAVVLPLLSKMYIVVGHMLARGVIEVESTHCSRKSQGLLS